VWHTPTTFLKGTPASHFTPPLSRPQPTTLLPIDN
jgi:hypothetical protein